MAGPVQGPVAAVNCADKVWLSAPYGSAVARLRGVGLRYGRVVALAAINLDMPEGRLIGLIGPDGVGKSSLLSLIAGARCLQAGTIEVLGGSMADPAHQRKTAPRIAFMPQGLGRNLYAALSVFENVDFFGRLFGQTRSERTRRIEALLEGTGLAAFAHRRAGTLSGGMKQKLGLCCALIHDPDLLILDEPTTGIDPLSRRQFWVLLASIRAARPDMSVLVSTAYMEEAAQFDFLVAMNSGKILASGTMDALLGQTRTASLEAAFITLLGKNRVDGHPFSGIPARATKADEVAIEARDLSKQFGDFVAVDHVSFRIQRGEIFGFLGSNGCGKTTTMKMLTGLMPASGGEAFLFGHKVSASDLNMRRRVGYMSQGFSLYTELTVRQNLALHARLFGAPRNVVAARVEEMARRFDLANVMDILPDTLPLGRRQRLSLAVALIHHPELLILDEPTSGVDPIARDDFWGILVELARRDGVTIFISTHFMNEAERCDRISFMHAGRVLVADAPASLIADRGVATLEEAFISYLKDTVVTQEEHGQTMPLSTAPKWPTSTSVRTKTPEPRQSFLRPSRVFSYTHREALELWRDPVRAALALAGSVILLLVLGYGMSFDVEHLSFAVLDQDQSIASQSYALNIAGSRYFVERAPITTPAQADRRMRSGRLALAIEIPPGFGRDIARGRNVEISALVDGAMPARAETVIGYLQALHAEWLTRHAARGRVPVSGGARIETRFRYNPGVKSIVAMVPADIPLLLMLIPAVLAALSVVREKELGSIVNFYVTPVTRLEFLLGKQVPYIVLAMANFLLLTLVAVVAFGVPLKGSFLALATASLLYVTDTTAFGLLMSTFTRSQIAALFGTAIITILPAVEFSGMINPVTSLTGVGALIGRIYPTAYYLTITRGVFAKGLGFTDLWIFFLPLLLAGPLLLGLSVLLLKKQAS